MVSERRSALQKTQDRLLPYIIFIIFLATVPLVILAVIKYDNWNFKNNPIIISVPAKQNNKTFEIKLDVTRLVGYEDIWRGHWCPYYNDRIDFLAIRINEILQRLRQYRVPIIHISFAAEASMKYTNERINAYSIIKKGNTSALNEYKPLPNESYHSYIPNFKDECLYDVYGKFNKYRDHDFSRAILISKKDYFVADFQEAAMAFQGLGAKHALIFGEHTNMCLMYVMMYCKKSDVIPVIVRDLVDAAWTYSNQNLTHPTHTSANNAVINYIEENIGPTICSYDLIRALSAIDIPKRKIRYYKNLKTAYYFNHSF